jgi:transcription elongation factor GreA
MMKARLELRLKTEVRELERELRIELPQQIKTAVALGDLKENAEYHAALERQRYVQARIGQIRKTLSDLSLINWGEIPKDRIGLGSRVVLYEDETEKEITYDLVLPDDGDVPSGRISIASPIGKGLMGHRDGDEVTIRIPSGTKVYEIVEFRTVHDLGGDGLNPDSGAGSDAATDSDDE